VPLDGEKNVSGTYFFSPGCACIGMKQHTRLSGNAVAGLLLMTAVSAFACKVIPGPLPPPDALFSGTVTSIAAIEDDGWWMERVTFHVIETWKGSNTVSKTVISGLGSCSHHFTVGEDYWVYAFANEGDLYTSTPWPTGLLSDGHNLGEGQKSDVPLLKMAPNAGGIALSWRTNWNGFHIETSETMEASSWRRLTNHVQTSGHYFVTTNDMRASRRFFRLAR
jgi:hypothetical protein